MVLILVWYLYWYGIDMHIIANAYYCYEMVCNGTGIGMQWYGIGIGISMVLYWYGIGILGICKRKINTMAMLCGTLSHIHVRIRDEKYSLVWSKNPILI